MSDDKIKEIRDRVEQDVAKGPANKEIYRVHKDRAFLLAEMDRQREENERLREMMLDIAEELRGEEPRIVFRIRKALEGKP